MIYRLQQKKLCSFYLHLGCCILSGHPFSGCSLLDHSHDDVRSPRHTERLQVGVPVHNPSWAKSSSKILVQDSYIEWGSLQIIPDWMHLHHSIISLHLWSRHCTTETCHPAELCLNSWPTESLNIIKRLLFMPLVCGDLLCSNSCCNSGSQLSGL